MNGLEERYNDQIDFFHLDVDQAVTLDLRQQFSIVGRNQYVLVDSNGEVIERWVGPLSEGNVEAVLLNYLATVP